MLKLEDDEEEAVSQLVLLHGCKQSGSSLSYMYELKMERRPAPLSIFFFFCLSADSVLVT